MDEFDLEYEEVAEVNEALRVDPRSLDKRICICGHAMSRHHWNRHTNSHYCKPGQLSCSCLIPRAVLEVPNTRYFMRKSHGSGSKHALAMGVAASIEYLGEEEFSKSRKWLVEEVCDACKEPAKFYPVIVTQDGQVVTDMKFDKGYTAFLCPACR